MASHRRYRYLQAELSERLKQNYRLAKALPEFLRAAITPAAAEQGVRRMLQDRELRFLDLAQFAWQVFSRSSPM
jgi:hypothetical protein